MPLPPILESPLTYSDHWSYTHNGPTAAEPAAWASLALSMVDNPQAAVRPALWLKSLQGQDGSVGVVEGHATPAWTTALAILAWQTLNNRHGEHRFDEAIDHAVDWAFANYGLPAERQPHIGHDTTLLGWSWADATHSWLEPTAFFVTALRLAGHGLHDRVDEGLRLVADRILPSGGCNYGNTVVLGQELLPHVQPTGIALLALARTGYASDGVDASIAYLQQAIKPRTTLHSRCYGLLGLTAHGVDADSEIDRLATYLANERAIILSAYSAALAVLATHGFGPWLAEHYTLAAKNSIEAGITS